MADSGLGECKTPNCGEEAEYGFSVGALRLCHDCYERLKVLISDMEEYEEDEDED